MTVAQRQRIWEIAVRIVCVVVVPLAFLAGGALGNHESRISVIEGQQEAEEHVDHDWREDVVQRLARIEALLGD